MTDKNEATATVNKAATTRCRRFMPDKISPPRPDRIWCEVQYDHFSGGRFRHGTKFLRWRPDKKPKHCTMDQVLLNKEKPFLPLMNADKYELKSWSQITSPA